MTAGINVARHLRADHPLLDGLPVCIADTGWRHAPAFPDIPLITSQPPFSKHSRGLVLKSGKIQMGNTLQQLFFARHLARRRTAA